jgi:hypothetical protein
VTRRIAGGRPTRSIAASHSAFASDEVKRRASHEYDTVLAVSQAAFIPFDEAWQTVLALVAKLAIPA